MHSHTPVKYTRHQDHDIFMNDDSIDIERGVSDFDYSSSSKRSVYYTGAAILGMATIGVALYLTVTAIQNVSEEILTNEPDEFDVQKTICELTQGMSSCLYNGTSHMITSALEGYETACDKIQTCLSEHNLYGLTEGLQHTVKNICNDVFIKVCDKVTGKEFTIAPDSLNVDVKSASPDSFYACGTKSCDNIAGNYAGFPT